MELFTKNVVSKSLNNQSIFRRVPWGHDIWSYYLGPETNCIRHFPSGAKCWRTNKKYCERTAFVQASYKNARNGLWACCPPPDQKNKRTSSCPQSGGSIHWAVWTWLGKTLSHAAWQNSLLLFTPIFFLAISTFPGSPRMRAKYCTTLLTLTTKFWCQLPC